MIASKKHESNNKINFFDKNWYEKIKVKEKGIKKKMKTKPNCIHIDERPIWNEWLKISVESLLLQDKKTKYQEWRFEKTFNLK